jgi:hypothetical protein
MVNWVVLPGALLLLLIAGSLWYRLIRDIIRQRRENSPREEPTP